MISIEVKLGGILLGFAYVVKKGQIKDKLYKYSVEYHRVKEEPPVLNFDIAYEREKGVDGLVLEVYKGLDKELEMWKKTKNGK